jgi:CRP/FNR family cyclic AMP-dependent transcriptional regulator
MQEEIWSSLLPRTAMHSTGTVRTAAGNPQRFQGSAGREAFRGRFTALFAWVSITTVCLSASGGTITTAVALQCIKAHTWVMHDSPQLKSYSQAAAPAIDEPAPRQWPLEDPLAYLPCSALRSYTKGQTIYNLDQPSTSLCLIIEGRVKLSRPTGRERQVVVDVYQPDDFFGESSLLGEAHGPEIAVALENTKLMTWTTAEIQEIAGRRPKLTIALLQLMVQRSADFVTRIESLSADDMSHRLARALVRFAGSPGEDGTTPLIPFTHALLSQYVGTSREIVTHHMNRFRRNGYLSYSRKGILLRGDALHKWLAS